MTAAVLILPGWHNSGPDHWQSLWEAQHGYTRVPQHNWDFPLRGDWMIQLEEAVLRHEQVVLVADRLATHLVAAWAAHSRQTHRVLAALLVATPALTAPQDTVRLPSWQPVLRKVLPFPCLSVAAEPGAPVQDWGARVLAAIGPSPDDADWEAGWQLLQSQLQEFIATN